MLQDLGISDSFEVKGARSPSAEAKYTGTIYIDNIHAVYRKEVVDCKHVHEEVVRKEDIPDPGSPEKQEGGEFDPKSEFGIFDTDLSGLEGFPDDSDIPEEDP